MKYFPLFWTPGSHLRQATEKLFQEAGFLIILIIPIINPKLSFNLFQLGINIYFVIFSRENGQQKCTEPISFPNCSYKDTLPLQILHFVSIT